MHIGADSHCSLIFLGRLNRYRRITFLMCSRIKRRRNQTDDNLSSRDRGLASHFLHFKFRLRTRGTSLDNKACIYIFLFYSLYITPWKAMRAETYQLCKTSHRAHVQFCFLVAFLFNFARVCFLSLAQGRKKLTPFAWSLCQWPKLSIGLNINWLKLEKLHTSNGTPYIYTWSVLMNGAVAPMQ